MTRFEELLEGHFANELSPEEQTEFAALLRDDERRRLFEAHQRTAALLTGLTRHAPSPTFTEEVVSRLPEQTSSLHRRLWTLLWAPRVVRWNLASALALTVVVLAMTPAVWRKFVDGTTVAPPPRHVVTLFRFSVEAPGAQRVAVAGDFNGWRTDEIFLSDITGHGHFAVTLPLRPGRYGYMFVVDGAAWMTDPHATAYRDDGFGNRNALVTIETPQTSRAPNDRT
jgi:AMP-activated protein kinase-like protein